MKILLPLLAFAGLVVVLGSMPRPEPEAKATTRDAQLLVERGQYLVKYGGCSDCHTPLKFGEHGPVPDLTRFLSGHPADAPLPPPPALPPGPWFAQTAGMTAWAGPWGVTYAANLTPDESTGLGIWTEEIFVRAMREGKHWGSGRPILPPMPWENVGALNDSDLKAVFAYLKSLPPVKNRVPDAQIAGQIAVQE